MYKIKEKILFLFKNQPFFSIFEFNIKKNNTFLIFLNILIDCMLKNPIHRDFANLKTPFYPFKTPFYTLALKKSDYFIKAHNRMVKLYEKHPFIHFKFIPSSLALKDNYRFFDVNYTIYFKGCF